MTATLLRGGGYLPAQVKTALPPGFVSSTLNGATEKHAFIFRVPLTGTIDTVEWCIGAVGNNPDNGIKVSLQDLDASGDPDGGADEFRVLTGTFTSNTWQTPGLITSDGTDGGTKRSVTAGQKLAFVVEFASFVASDSFNSNTLDLPTAPGGILGDNYTSFFDGATWTKALNSGAMALKYTTLGYVPVSDDWVPAIAFWNVAYGTGSASDEYALRLQTNVPLTIDGCWLLGELDGDCEAVLYNSAGSIVAGPCTVDASARVGTGATGRSLHNFRFDAVTLSPGSTYRLTLKPTTATTVTLYGWTANSNALLGAANGGLQWYRSKRADAGSWTDEDTLRPWMGLHVRAAESSGTLTRLPGGFYWPEPPYTDAGVPAVVSATLNGATEKYAEIFRMPQDGVIETIEWRISTVGNNPDNGIRVSLQNLDSSGHPDGTPLVFRNMAGPFTSSTWQTPGIMSDDGTDTGAKLTVAAGQVLAFVVDYVSFTASDSFNVQSLDNPVDPGGLSGYDYYIDFFDGASWSAALNPGFIAVKYVTDGYVPVVADMLPILALSSVVYNNGSANDEHALRFQVPIGCKCNGAAIRMDCDGDADVILYDASSSVLGSCSIDASARPQTGAHNHHVYWPEVTLSASTTYRLSIKPTTGTSLTLYGWTANSNALLGAAPGGIEWYRSKRADAGGWTDEDTERPWVSLHISSVYSTDPNTITIREAGAATERISYALTPAQVSTIREAAAARDRISYSLTQTFVATIRERAGATDRLTTANPTPIVATIRETALGTDKNEVGRTRVSGAIQAPTGPSMAILTHIYDYFGPGLDWAFSDIRRTAPVHGHAGRVMTWGTSTREIPIPPGGPPRLGRLTIEFDDNPAPITRVQFFRSQFGARTPKGKRVDLKIGISTGNESLFQIPAAGVIEHATFPPGKMRLEVVDNRYSWLQKPIPRLLDDATVFPNVPQKSKGAFYPYVLGIVSSVGFGNQGAIALPHFDTVNHRYAVSRNTAESVTVYRKRHDEQEFTIVSSGFTLIEELATIHGVQYNIAYIQFDEDQGDAEIRADVEGQNQRGAWGTLPPYVGVSRNVIDHVINVLFFTELVETVLVNYDYSSFATVRQQFEDSGWLADYAITEPLTPEVVLTQLFSTFMIHWFPSRLDKLKVVMTTAELPDNTPILGDFHSILVKSEQPELARETRNRFHYNFGKLHEGSGEFGGHGTYDNTADQAELTDSDGESIIEPENLDFHACRDEDVALLLAAEWSTWRDQQAHRVTFEVDLPEKLSTTDLAADFRLTHYGGLALGGWNRERFIPYRITDDFDRLRTRIDAIRKVTVVLPLPQTQAIGHFAKNSRISLSWVTGNKMLFAAYRDSRNDKKMVVLATNTAGETEPIDDGVFPQLGTKIDSFDSYRFGNKIHIWTQELTTGRAAYHVFDMSLQMWDVLNDEILTSNSDGDIGITGTVRPSGEPVAVFMGDRIAGGPATWDGMTIAGAGNYRRSYLSRLVDGSWTTPEVVGSPDDLAATFFPEGIPYNGAVNIRVGRAIAEADDWVKLVYTVDEPADVANTPEVYQQRLTPDNLLLAAEKIKFTASTWYTTTHVVGDPCVFEYLGQDYTAVPVGFTHHPMLFIWQGAGASGSGTQIELVDDVTAVTVQPDSFGTLNPPESVRFFKDKLRVVMGTREASTDDWAAYKTLSPPFTTVDPDALSEPRGDQVGPTWPGASYARHGIEFATINGVDYLFKVTAGNFGLPDSDAYSILERHNIATDIPEDNSYTLADWIADNA